MTAPQTKLPPRRSFWRRALIWTLRILIVLIVLGSAVYGTINYWAARSIREQVAQIRAAGQPLTFADLDTLLPKTDEPDDSGPYYAAAMALARDVDRETIPGYDAALQSGETGPAMLAQMQRRVENNRLALDMLDRGSKLSGCDYDMGLRYGIGVVLPRLNSSRTLAGAVSMRTRLLAFQGHGDEAAASAISSLGMLRMFDRQPVLVAYLVKIGCAALVCSDVKAVIEHGHPSAASLQTMESALAQVDRAMDLRSMFLAERVYYLEISRNIVSGAGRELQPGNGAEGISPPLPGQLPSNLALRVMVAKSLPIYGQFVQAAGKGWPEAVDAAKAVAAQPRSRWEMFAQVAAPSFARSVTTAARLEAQLRSAIVALRIERYRLANGRLPDSLDQLTDAASLPADPFTGKPLIYRKTADGYCVYGLGEQRRDAGGKDINRTGPNWGISVRLSGPATQPATSQP